MINELSDNLILKIINYLPTIQDVMKLKQTSKKFHSIIDKLNISSLVISHLKMALNQRWFYSYELVNSHFLKTTDYSLVQFDFQIFSHLKKLLIISSDYSNFEKYNLTKLFDQVNKLAELEHLELIGLKLEPSNFVELNLPNLKQLNLERIETGRGIRMNTPNLKNVKIDSFDSFEGKIHFNYPESVCLLMVNFYEKYIRSFVNCEYLYIEQKLLLKDVQETELIGSEKQLFLSYFPILKELQFYLEKQTYQYLIEQKQSLKKDELKIYFCGVDLIDFDLDVLPKTDWSPYQTLSHDTIKFYKNNFDRTASALPFVKRLIYDNFGFYVNKISVDLMNKFLNLNTIEVHDRIEDVKRFIEFLKCFKNMKTLHFENSGLNQRFFNMLPKLHPILDKLKIHTEQELDYSFILSFADLNVIYIDKNLDVDFVQMIFQKFGNLKLFFYYEDNEVALNVDGNKIFEFCIGQEKSLYFKSFDKLFGHFAEINFEELNDYQSDTCDFENDLYDDDLDMDLDSMI